jgi:hypothetical protein
VSDPGARLPALLELAHKLIAKCQNAALGRWENFWSSDKPSAVLLVLPPNLAFALRAAQAGGTHRRAFPTFPVSAYVVENA